jgi:hypothetical protein
MIATMETDSYWRTRCVGEAMDQGYTFLRLTCNCGRITDFPFPLPLRRRDVSPRCPGGNGSPHDRPALFTPRRSPWRFCQPVSAASWRAICSTVPSPSKRAPRVRPDAAWLIHVDFSMTSRRGVCHARRQPLLAVIAPSKPRKRKQPADDRGTPPTRGGD